jgi:hypothetical protein
MIRIISILSLLSFFSVMAVNASENVKKTVRYKSGKRIDFESLLIEGEKKKADYSVVTGNIGEEDLGLLKLRDNFTDFMANDAKEEVQ